MYANSCSLLLFVCYAPCEGLYHPIEGDLISYDESLLRDFIILMFYKVFTSDTEELELLDFHFIT